MSAFLRLARLASLAPVAAACAALFALMLMTFADVLMRSALDDPIEAATELTRVFMAIIVFSSLPVVSARGDHISVDLLDPLFRGRARRVRDALVALACGAMLTWPAGQAWKLALRARSYGDMTEYLHIPQYLPAGFVSLMTWAAAAALIARGALLLLAPHALREEEPGA
ncbi:TRAP transporter small permease [Oceanicella actignis]|uniref:TRAP transporter small permease n=1 Tax=Oceanicella actignis TaxID=1189325 RepID=UPI0011E6F8A9|nr:TRAP transporter small permease [Oceanicella actignis]TYO88578.1 TRAP-type C4-dicarboxylate transport system permease small subunit [Oceanicella actignis]